mgnify:CR=1 FL=1
MSEQERSNTDLLDHAVRIRLIESKVDELLRLFNEHVRDEQARNEQIRRVLERVHSNLSEDGESALMTALENAHKSSMSAVSSALDRLLTMMTEDRQARSAAKRAWLDAVVSAASAVWAKGGQYIVAAIAMILMGLLNKAGMTLPFFPSAERTIVQVPLPPAPQVVNASEEDP